MAVDFVIEKELLQGIKMTPEELRLELAVFLYARKQLSMGKAKRLAGLDLIAFQKELAKRQISIHYDIDDLKEDMKNLGISH